MNTFKAGDWIKCNEDNIIFKYEGDNEINNNYYSQENWDDEFELWQPQEEEWCWFWNRNNLIQELRLAQFLRKDNTFYSIHGHEFDCCEPFIGKLPSFIED